MTQIKKGQVWRRRAHLVNTITIKIIAVDGDRLLYEKLGYIGLDTNQFWYDVIDFEGDYELIKDVGEDTKALREDKMKPGDVYYIPTQPFRLYTIKSISDDGLVYWDKPYDKVPPTIVDIVQKHMVLKEKDELDDIENTLLKSGPSEVDKSAIMDCYVREKGSDGSVKHAFIFEYLFPYYIILLRLDSQKERDAIFDTIKSPQLRCALHDIQRIAPIALHDISMSRRWGNERYAMRNNEIKLCNRRPDGGKLFETDGTTACFDMFKKI